MEIAKFLELVAQREGSDVFLSPGGPPCIKIKGVTYHITHDPLSAEDTRAMAYALMNERQQKEFEQTMEMNLAVALKDVDHEKYAAIGESDRMTLKFVKPKK